MDAQKIFFEKNRKKYENINNYLKNVTDSSHKIIDSGFVLDTVKNQALILLNKKVYELENYYSLFDVDICRKFLNRFGFKSYLDNQQSAIYESVDDWLLNIHTFPMNYFSNNIEKNSFFIENIKDYRELLELLGVLVTIVNRHTNLVPKVIRIHIYRFLDNVKNRQLLIVGGGYVDNLNKLVESMRTKLVEDNKLMDEYFTKLQEYSSKIKKINPHLSENLINLLHSLSEIREEANLYKQEYLNSIMYFGLMGDNYKYMSRGNDLINIPNFKKIYEDIVMKDNLIDIEKLEDYNLL
jgi:hypothetical protein